MQTAPDASGPAVRVIEVLRHVKSHLGTRLSLTGYPE